MVKITSFKDVETYIYTSIVLPLKNPSLVEFRYPTPIRDKQGNRWNFSLQRTRVVDGFRHQYQRELALRNRNYWIILDRGENFPPVVVGEYHRKTHWVKLWSEPFKEAGAVTIFNKLFEVLDTTTPFTKVMEQSGNPPSYEAGYPY